MSETPAGRNLVLKDGVLTLARDPETGRYAESGCYPAEGRRRWAEFDRDGYHWKIREYTKDDAWRFQHGSDEGVTLVSYEGEPWVLVEKGRIEGIAYCQACGFTLAECRCGG